MNQAITILATAALSLFALGAALIEDISFGPTAAAATATATATATEIEAEAEAAAAEPAMREIEVVVDGGFDPGRITIQEGERVRLRFVRRDPSPCGAEIVIASLGIRQALTLDAPVSVDLPPLPAGEVEFRCGMNMLRGRLVVVSREG